MTFVQGTFLFVADHNERRPLYLSILSLRRSLFVPAIGKNKS